MPAVVFDMIRRGQTAELAAEIEEHPALAAVRDPQGVSPLLCAIYTGQPIIRDFLRTRVASLDVFEAAALGDTAQLTALLAADRAAANAFSGDGWTPLHLAAAFAGPDAIRLLLERGARIDAVSRNPQQNQPLHAAIALGHSTQSVRLLLDEGADVNAPQAGGYTPLHQAASAGRREIVDLLLERGANPAQLCNRGKPPSAYARERGHIELAEYLEARRLPPV